MCGHHPVAPRRARLTAGFLCLCLSGGLAACGVSTDVYTRTLHERDQLRDHVGQAETAAAVQRQQADALRTALTEQQQASRALQARVTELEALTADQNLAHEALTQQLRSLTAEREELLLRLDESKPLTPGRPAASGEAHSADAEAGAQRLTVALHDAIEAGHLTVHRVGHGLDLRLAESFLFVPDKAELTAEGQRALSTMGTALSGVRPRRLQLRLPWPAAAAGDESGRARGNRATAVARLLALARQFSGGEAGSSELVLETERRESAPSPAVAFTPEQAISAGEIQVLLEWPLGP